MRYILYFFSPWNSTESLLVLRVCSGRELPNKKQSIWYPNRTPLVKFSGTGLQCTNMDVELVLLVLYAVIIFGAALGTAEEKSIFKKYVRNSC